MATVAFTSGTTGPGAASCSAKPARSRSHGSSRRTSGCASRTPRYSLLPLAHATPRLYDAYAPLVAGLDAQLRRVARDGPARPRRGGADRARRDPEAARARPGRHRAPDRSRRAVQARLVPMGHAPAHVGRRTRGSPDAAARAPAPGSPAASWRAFVKRQAGLGRRALPRHRRLLPRARLAALVLGARRPLSGSSTARSRRAGS